MTGDAECMMSESTSSTLTVLSVSEVVFLSPSERFAGMAANRRDARDGVWLYVVVCDCVLL